MSEWNKKGEECDCGSTTAHKRSPGCTVPETSPIYERGWHGGEWVTPYEIEETAPVGGCMTIDSRGIEAVRHSLPLMGFDHGLGRFLPDLKASIASRADDLTRRIYEADARETCAPRPTGPIVGLAAMLPPLSPAAMLGEALALANRAEAAAFDANHALSTSAVAEDIKTARVLLIEAVTALKRAMLGAEARGVKP